MEAQKHVYRTKKAAGKTSDVPDVVASPSTRSFSTAITVMQGNKTPHIVPIQQAIKIEYKEGQFYAGGVDLAEIDLDHVRDPQLTGLDLPTLRVLYSTILQDLTDAFMEGKLDESNILMHSVTIRVPELMKKMGMK